MYAVVTASLVGSQLFGRLGMTLAAADVHSTGTDLVVAQTTAWTLGGGFESGVIYSYRGGGATFPMGTVTDPFACDWFANGLAKSSRLGSTVAFYDSNGDGAT